MNDEGGPLNGLLAHALGHVSHSVAGRNDQVFGQPDTTRRADGVFSAVHCDVQHTSIVVDLQWTRENLEISAGKVL